MPEKGKILLLWAPGGFLLNCDALTCTRRYAVEFDSIEEADEFIDKELEKEERSLCIKVQEIID